MHKEGGLKFVCGVEAVRVVGWWSSKAHWESEVQQKLDSSQELVVGVVGLIRANGQVASGDQLSGGIACKGQEMQGLGQ